MRATVRKTKAMQLLDGKRRVTAKIDPCNVSEERVGCNSITADQMFHMALLPCVMSFFVDLVWDFLLQK